MLYHNIYGYDVKVTRRCRLRQQFYSFQSELRGLLLTILRGKRQQRRARTVAAVRAAIVAVREEHPSAGATERVTTAYEPLAGQVDEVGATAAPRLSAARDRLDVLGFI